MTETVESTPCEPAPCEHHWQSHHVPGHVVYWVRLCGLCGLPDWDDLDREIAKATGLVTEQAVRDVIAEKFGDTVNRITDETVTAKLAEVESAVRADERKRIRELADRTRAVCAGGDGTSFFFSALIDDKPEASL